jgi:hypothetical protein
MTEGNYSNVGHRGPVYKGLGAMNPCDNLHLLLECIHVTTLQQLAKTSGIPTPFRRTMGFLVPLSSVSRAQDHYSGVRTHNWNNLKLVSIFFSPTLCITGTRFIFNVKHQHRNFVPNICLKIFKSFFFKLYFMPAPEEYNFILQSVGEY